MTYKIISYNTIKNNKSDSKVMNRYFAFIENDDNLAEYISEYFSDKKIEIFKSEYFESKIAEIQKDNLDNVVLISNSKKLLNSTKKINSLYIRKNDKDISTIIYHTEDFDKKISNQNIDYHLADDDFDIYKKIKHTPKNISKILYINKFKLTLAYKIHGVWRVKNDLELQIAYSIFNKRKIKMEEFELLAFNDLKNDSYEESMLIKENEIQYQNEYFESKEYENKLLWILDDFFVYNVSNSSSSKFFHYEKIDIKEISKKQIEIMFFEIENNSDGYAGIEFKVLKRNDESFELECRFGKVYFEKENDTGKLFLDFYSTTDESDIITAANQLKKNLVMGVSKKTPIKINKFEIIKSIFAFAIVVLLLYITFNFIFSKDNMNNAFNNVLGPHVFNRPWIYFIILIFITNLLLPFLNSIIIEKFVIKQEKLLFSRLWVYFIASQMWSLTRFLTGNYLLAVFVWGWWINKKLKVSGATLFSTFTSTAFIRAFMFMIIGGVFMISGTIKFFNDYYIPDVEGTMVIIIMSWSAYVFEWLSGMIMFVMLISPWLQSIISNLLMKFKYIGKSVDNSFLENTYKNIYVIKRDSIMKELFRNKELFYRYLILISIPIVLEGLDTLMFFNLVESSILEQSGYLANNDFAPYWNIVSLTGIRLMSSLVHKFPLINLIPGGGIGFTEISLKILYEPIFASHTSSIPIEYLGGYGYDDIAEMATFIQRFFHTYLKLLFVFALSISAILYEQIIRRGKHG